MNKDEGKAFKIHCMKEPDYVMKLMASCMTLKYLEDANTKRDWKENGVRKSNFFSTNNPLVCTLGTGIRLMTTINSGMNQYILKQHGQQSYWMIETSLGTWQCQLLMPILIMDTFKMGVN